MRRMMIPSLMLLLTGLPLLGIALTGTPIAPILQYPPNPPAVLHAPFSWLVFIGITLLALAMILLIVRLIYWQRGIAAPSPHPMPHWGWWALATLIASWILAWTRFSWFAEYQYYTFAPLWVSFIVVLNAITYRRSGHSLITHAPHYLLKLFLFSALFWWYFELLNRLVQNWSYAGLAPGGLLLYLTSSTVAFSTVLPGVISMAELLATVPMLESSRCTVRFDLHRPFVIKMLAVTGSVGLLLIGIFPNLLFPLLWVAPLLLILAFQLRCGDSNLINGCAAGCWHQLTIPMLAGVICGLLWEMWNGYSHTVWHYAIPYVDRFHLFEMPILGYAGYLPFGLECIAAAQLIKTINRSS